MSSTGRSCCATSVPGTGRRGCSRRCSRTSSTRTSGAISGCSRCASTNRRPRGRGWRHVARGMKSAAEQLDGAARVPRARRSRAPPSSAIALSASGYARLGVERAQLARRPGLSRRASAPGTSEIPTRSAGRLAYRDGIDALVLVGSHDDELTERNGARGATPARRLGRGLIAEETGSTLDERATATRIEHFGYVDGRSQPLFIDEDLDRERDRPTARPLEPARPARARARTRPRRRRLRPRATAATSSTASSSRTSGAFKQQEARLAERARPRRARTPSGRARCSSAASRTGRRWRSRRPRAWAIRSRTTSPTTTTRTALAARSARTSGG